MATTGDLEELGRRLNDATTNMQIAVTGFCGQLSQACERATTALVSAFDIAFASSGLYDLMSDMLPDTSDERKRNREMLRELRAADGIQHPRTWES
jgi:hypothetical protein